MLVGVNQNSTPATISSLIQIPFNLINMVPLVADFEEHIIYGLILYHST